jgi:hypothetical protein
MGVKATGQEFEADPFSQMDLFGSNDPPVVLEFK